MTIIDETATARILERKIRTDVRTDAALAADLRRRADLLENGSPNQPNKPPRETGREYAELLRFVQWNVGGYDGWAIERIARRVWTTGECLWHAAYVIAGRPDGRGCDCGPCRLDSEAGR